MGTVNPLIEWCKLANRRCLKFTFRGHLTFDEAQRAIDTWRNAFSEKHEAQIPLVWDCLNMEGYSRKARSVWTHAMMEMKPQIAAIWLVSDSSLIKMGASVMALFSGLTVHNVKSEHEIRAAHTSPPGPFIDKPPRDDQTDSVPL